MIVAEADVPWQMICKQAGPKSLMTAMHKQHQHLVKFDTVTKAVHTII